MGISAQIAAKQKTASGTAQGVAMEKRPPIVGDSPPSTSNDQQAVTRNQGWSQKKLSHKRVTSGY